MPYKYNPLSNEIDEIGFEQNEFYQYTSSLHLGTAASKNTGTVPGDVPILDANGKVVIDVIPSSIAGGQVYKGSWDASGGVYPVATIVGETWIISTSGTISGTLYNKNDLIIWNGSTFDHIDNSELITFAQDIHRRGFINHTSTLKPYLSGANMDVVVLEDAGAGWDYYIDGTKIHIDGNKTVALSGSEGNPHVNDMHWIYIDDDSGTLKTTFTPDIINTVLVANVFWHDDQASDKGIIADERHTVLWDSSIHVYEHITNGAVLLSGGIINSYVTNSFSDLSKQYGISLTNVADEDIWHTLPALVGGGINQYANFYRSDTDIWAWELNADFPFRYSAGGNMLYDNGTESGSIITENYYVNTYILATNLTGQARFINITSQQEYATENEAYGESLIDLNLSGFNLPEYVTLYKIAWHITGNTGIGHCEIIKVIPYNVNPIDLLYIKDTASNISADRVAINYTPTDVHIKGHLDGIDTELGNKISTDTTINGKILSGSFTLNASEVSESINKRYVTDVELLVLQNTSNTNTGDETISTIKSKLGVSVLTGSNTGDQDLSTLVPKTYTVNSKPLSGSIVLGTADITDSTDKRYVTDVKLTQIGVSYATIRFGSNSNIGTATGPVYFLADNNSAISNTDSIAVGTRQIISNGGNIKKLYVALSTAPGNGKKRVFTVYINGVASALTCTISNTNTTGNDTANTVAINAGDQVSLGMTTTGNPSNSDGAIIGFIHTF